MKQRLVNFSFLVSGHVQQDIVITDPDLSGKELVAMLNRTEAFTTVDDDGDVINAEGNVIGTVQYSDRELEYTEFQMEDGEYEQENSLQSFNGSRLALHHAVGEYIDEPEMTIDEVIDVLGQCAYSPPMLNVHENIEGWTGKDILEEIRKSEHDLMNLMTIAHAAGKQGQELI